MAALNCKKDVVLILLDLSAAFDTIDHDILFHRLENRFGVSGLALQWFKSYLSNRTYSVSLKSLPSSKSVTVSFGVPQGSVLGPILFTLYTAPLEDIFNEHDLDFMLYADDTQLYVICDKPSESIFKIKTCLNDIRLWMRSNLLILNDDKTEVIHFLSRYKKNYEQLTSLRVGGSDIIPSTCIRNIGSFFMSTGDVSAHINHVCKSSFYALYRIGKLRTLLDNTCIEKLVHAFISSRLDYCNSILYGCPSYEIQKLQSVQNAAARLITHSKKYDHITPILKELHWLPVQERIIFKNLLLVKKILSNEAPLYLSDFVEFYVPGRTNLRSTKSNVLILKRKDTKTTCKNYGWRDFRVFAPFLWNDLPVFIRQTESIDNFKKRLKTYLFVRHFR